MLLESFSSALYTDRVFPWPALLAELTLAFLMAKQNVHRLPPLNRANRCRALDNTNRMGLLQFGGALNLSVSFPVQN